jgi:hypothetical protein
MVWMGGSWFGCGASGANWPWRRPAALSRREKKEKRENIVEFFSYVSPFFTEPQRVKRRRRRRRNNSHHHHHHHHGNKRKKKTEGRRGSRSITKLAAAAAATGKWMERTAGRQMALIRKRNGSENKSIF